MTATTPVERVAAVLVASGYRRLEMPLRIGGLDFDLAAAFLGDKLSPDLVLVADTAFDSEQRIQQKLEGVARVLDVMRSRRPMTAVLVGPRPRSTTLDGISRVCRVLPVGDAEGDASLRDWLAVLLPLDLPEPADEGGDLAETFDDGTGRDEMTAALLAAARQGEGAVRERLHALIAEPFDSNDVSLEQGP
jgi:hypothetical protein